MLNGLQFFVDFPVHWKRDFRFRKGRLRRQEVPVTSNFVQNLEPKFAPENGSEINAVKPF